MSTLTFPNAMFTVFEETKNFSEDQIVEHIRSAYVASGVVAELDIEVGDVENNERPVHVLCYSELPSELYYNISLELDEEFELTALSLRFVN